MITLEQFRKCTPALVTTELFSMSYAGSTRVGKLGKQFQNEFKCVCCGVQGSFIARYQQMGELANKTARPHHDVFAVVGDKVVMLTVDHILPRSKAGKDCDPNRRVMCQLCNSKRGNRISDEDWAYILDHYEEIVGLDMKTADNFRKELLSRTEPSIATSVIHVMIMSQMVWPYVSKQRPNKSKRRLEVCNV